MISAEQIDPIGARHHSGLEAPPKIKLSKLVRGAVAQQVQGIGTRAENLEVASGQRMSASAISERFQILPPEVFGQIMDAALKPPSHPRRHPEAFYKGMRLTGIDGVKFPVANTEAVETQMKKAGSRRGQAAFAHIGMTWIGERSLHHPIATDELKNKLHRRDLLKSQTPRTATQELAALIMAQSVLAQVRMTVAGQAKVPTLRVSFAKTRHYMQGLWLVIENGHGILSQKQIQGLVSRVIQRIANQLTHPRRKRSCPRAVRQPVSRWPRLMKNVSHSSSFLYKVTPIK